MELNLPTSNTNGTAECSSQRLVNVFNSIYDDDIEDDYDSIGEYFFESQRLAYKTDPDYKNLVQAIVVIEAAQEQARKDLHKLQSLQMEAVDNSEEFVEKIKNNEDLQVKETPKPPCIPSLDWQKYSKFENSLKSRKLYNSINSEGGDIGQTFNKPWTAEEQSRLEELLLMFPPEEIESRRWEKISRELGTRTPIQVASRVQKYFEKLYKAGFPIPGHYSSFGYLNKKYRKSSSGRFYNIPAVNMNDDNSKDSFNSVTSSNEDNISGDEDISDVEDIDPELRNTAEYQELLLIKKTLKRKLPDG